MKLLSIIWQIFVNLVIGVVILSLFHFTNSRFESIVISVLVLIYITVIGSYMSLGNMLLRKWDFDLAHHIVIAKALSLNTEAEEAALRESQEEKTKGQIAFWLKTIFITLFGLIAIGNLFYAIMS